jgi:quinol monooxygenase YgiN
MKNSNVCSVLLSVLCLVFVLFSCNQAPKEKVVAEDVPQAEVFVDALTIVADITAAPEFEAEVIAAIEAVVEGTRTEEGCISYDVYKDVNNSLRFTFIEHWKSREAIELHNSSAHFLKFVESIDGKVGLEAHTMKREY